MKKFKQVKYHIVAAVAIMAGLASCKKDDTKGGQIVGSKGTPTITSVRTVSKSTVDSSRTTSTTTYNSSGVATTTTASNYNPVLSAFDSTTVTGVLGSYYAVKGTHLGSVTKITVNNVNVNFNRALGDDNTVVFSIPSNIPYIQPQPNNITITTLYGTVTYGFTTLPPPPTIINQSDYYFSKATPTITLTGKGFSAVTSITLRSTTEKVNITTQNDSTLVLAMPTGTTASRSTLLFAYTAAGKALQTASKAEFIDIDNNYAVFANGSYQNSWVDASWQSPSGASATAPSKTGKGSIVATYTAGGYKVEGMANWYPSFAYDPAYKYLTFWIKGGKADHVLYLVSDAGPGGYGNTYTPTTVPAAQVVTVPAGVWTFVKVPVGTANGTFNFWGSSPNSSTVAKQLGLFLRGVSGDVDETMYLDEVAFIK